MSEPTTLIGAFVAGVALTAPVVAALWRAYQRERTRADRRAPEAASPAPAPAPSPRQPDPDPTGPRILLVDDDDEDAQLFRTALRTFGARVTVANSAERSLDLLHREHFSLVVVDVRLPGLSGPDLVSLVRPKVLLMSGLPAEDLRELADACGADAYLHKSGDIRELRQAVARLLSRHGALPMGDGRASGTGEG